MESKNYNLRSLRGDDAYSDAQFQADMQDVGIYVPDHLLYTPELNEFVAGEIRKQNIEQMQTGINPSTGLKYTKEEATKYADKAYKDTVAKAKKLAE